jgi:hypothetical protein
VDRLYQESGVPAGGRWLFQQWIKVTTKPGAASFAIELPTANWSDIWLSIIGLGVLTAITSFISALLYRSSAVIATMSQLTPDQQRAVNQLVQFARPAPAAAIGNIIRAICGKRRQAREMQIRPLCEPIRPT